MWEDIHSFDGDTYTIKKGDTLTKITNKFNQIYETDYTVDEVAQACGIKNKNLIYENDQLDFSSILPEWHVEGRGSGTGGWVGALFIKFGAEADLSGYTMDFTIKETGETFKEKYYSLMQTGKALKVGYGFYTIDIEASATFKGKHPTAEEIKDSFAGPSKNIGGSFLVAGITGSDSGIWLVNTGGLSFSGGLPFSIGIEDSITWRRGK